MCSSECLGPAQLARIPLHLEVLVTFRLTKAKHLGVVADECDAFAWVAWPRAEVAGLDPGRQSGQ